MGSLWGSEGCYGGCMSVYGAVWGQGVSLGSLWGSMGLYGVSMGSLWGLHEALWGSTGL